MNRRTNNLCDQLQTDIDTYYVHNKTTRSIPS